MSIEDCRICTTNISSSRNITGTKVLIMQIVPEWYKEVVNDYKFYDENTDTYYIKELSPSKDLLFSYKNNKISEDDYIEIYVKQIINNPIGVKKLFDIIKERDLKEVHLMCICSMGKFCHRNLLKEILEDPIVKELI